MSDSEKTLAALDHVIGYYHVAEEVEPVIRDGYAAYLYCFDVTVKHCFSCESEAVRISI